MTNAQRILGRWGEQISVTQNGETNVAKAIIQPMNRRWETYLSGERVPSGVINNNHYFMIASAELAISQSSGGIVECSDKKYLIRSCGDFKVRDKKLYVWAVLTARTEAMEDDYD